ncbi:hypothetical protein AC579_2991 [Pseudocercospora musae]|uniref:Uncharacterized protein n=1 Tax=Pseudocercospora musae TaxID=113226 RepID=A0A139I0W1_9PEZI|nr:hypothetical protein AC579_2991 [Pseudocercospora musae]KXT08376.1 hypothetical protein AC579_2991 [Pseudocercospora musae]
MPQGLYVTTYVHPTTNASKAARMLHYLNTLLILMVTVLRTHAAAPYASASSSFPACYLLR